MDLFLNRLALPAALKPTSSTVLPVGACDAKLGWFWGDPPEPKPHYSIVPMFVSIIPIPKGPKHQYGTSYGFCSSNLPYALGKYSPFGYLGPFGYVTPILP